MSAQDRPPVGTVALVEGRVAVRVGDDDGASHWLWLNGDWTAIPVSDVVTWGHVDDLEPAPEPCTEETFSRWHYRPEQIDPYWVRCTLTGPHDAHKNGELGLTWPRDPAPSAPSPAPTTGEPA